MWREVATLHSGDSTAGVLEMEMLVPSSQALLVFLKVPECSHRQPCLLLASLVASGAETF